MLSKMPGMVFIVGMPRSGTTLLTNMLNSHSHIVATPENEFVLYAASGFSNKDFSDPKSAEDFLGIFDHSFNKEMSIWKPKDSVKNYIGQLTTKNYASVCKAVYLNYPFAGDKEEVKYVVDKNPPYSLYIERLHQIFPEAKFIILTRDFRDNVLSQIKYARGKQSLFNAGAAWNYYYQKIFSSVNNDQLPHLVLKYEELASQPELSLKNICQFLNVPYEEKMMHYQGLSKEMIDHIKENAPQDTFNQINAMHGNLMSEVNSKRIRAYEKELTSDEIALLEYVCGEQARKLGYEVEKPQSVKFSWKIAAVYNALKVKFFYGWRAFYYRLPVLLRLIFTSKA